MRTMDWMRGAAIAGLALALCVEKANAQQYVTMAQEPAGIPVVYGRNAMTAGSKFSADYHAGWYQHNANRFAYMQWMTLRAQEAEMRRNELLAKRAEAQGMISMPAVSTSSAPMVVTSPAPIMVQTPSELKPIVVDGPGKVLSSNVISERVYRINPDGSQTLISTNGAPSAIPAEPVPTKIGTKAKTLVR